MAIKEQWKKIKENWIIVVAVIVLLMFMNFGSLRNASYSLNSVSPQMGSASYDSGGYSESKMMIPAPEDFAPSVEDRKITKSASINSEVEKDSFKPAEQRLRDIVSSSGSYILNENINRYGSKRSEYFQGSFQIKVDTKKYNSVIAQLKEVGEVKSFSENAEDITGQYTNSEINLEVEKARLDRYWQLYGEAKTVEDKLSINDRIFDQERNIKYLEDYLKNINQQIDYSSVYFTLTEKRSGYADVVLVKFASLIQNFVDSVNSLLVFTFTIIPWAVLILIIGIIWRIAKRRKRK